MTALKETKTAYHLSEVFGQISQSVNGTRGLCRIERAGHDQTCDPSRTKSVWPQTGHGLTELTHSIDWLIRPTSSDKWKAPVSMVFTREAIISTSDVRTTLLISIFCSIITANDQRYWDCECGLSLCLCRYWKPGSNLRSIGKSGVGLENRGILDFQSNTTSENGLCTSFNKLLLQPSF